MQAPGEPVAAASAPGTTAPVRRSWRRWLRWLAAVLILAGLGAGITYERFRHTYPKSVRVLAARVKPGMTLAEVEAIFGKPRGGDTIVINRWRWEMWRNGIGASSMLPLNCFAWWEDSEEDGYSRALIHFEPMTETVREKDYCLVSDIQYPPSERALRWMKDQWQRWFR